MVFCFLGHQDLPERVSKFLGGDGSTFIVVTGTKVTAVNGLIVNGLIVTKKLTKGRVAEKTFTARHSLSFRWRGTKTWHLNSEFWPDILGGYCCRNPRCMVVNLLATINVPEQNHHIKVMSHAI